VRKTPVKTWLLVGFFLLMPWVAHAAGLGKLTIRSALGQPLLAEVDLVSVQTGELATLVARLPPPEVFTQANVAYSPALVGVRMSIERRADGLPYIRIISTRPVNEPYIDLLVELSWPQGRLVREYTALIDPTGYTPEGPVAPVEPVVPPIAVTLPVTPESKLIVPAPQPPVAAAVPLETKPAAAKPQPVKPPMATAAAAADQAYGPVKRGETLARIASKVKPEGVTLEQMLVSLYHANPDAFAGNMNHLKTGKILRVPERERVIATGQSEAVKEVRVESANWNAYRRKLADAAGETQAREPKSAASGKITTKVDDKAAGKAAPKEVLKLSKGEPAAGKASTGKGARGSVPNRIRLLEEEAIAREKALAEANNRIVQLEKTIKDMQRVLEIKAQPPIAKPAPPPAPAPEPDLIEQIMDEPAYLAAVLALVGLGGYLFVRRRRMQADSDEPAGKKIKIEPEIDTKMAAAGSTGVLARMGGFLSARFRRAQAGDGEATRERVAPELMAPAADATVSAKRAAEPVTPLPVAGGTEEVDPLAEADMYLNFGRDVQAEEVLKEALAKTPGHEEAQLKLLQVYAGRKDKVSFNKIARILHAQTKGAGDNWIKAAAMGFAFDSKNALYEAGKSAPAATPIVGGVGPDLDFNFDLDAASTASAANTDLIDAPAAETDQAVSMQPGENTGTASIQPPSKPDAGLDVPGNKTVMADVAGDPATPLSNMIDFSFDALAPVQAPVELADSDKDKGTQHDGAPIVSPVQQRMAAAPEPGMDIEFGMGNKPEAFSFPGENIGAPEQPVEAASTGMPMLEPDFKLEFGGSETALPLAPAFKLDDINLNFEEGSAAAIPKAESGARDGHWYDVQTKFDLAKAYQEMGEKDGAREILQEVIKEGDAGQQAEAQKLLQSLD
jgi:pilus assembly protein FimV